MNFHHSKFKQRGMIKIYTRMSGANGSIRAKIFSYILAPKKI